jgi:hypothetical protein
LLYVSRVGDTPNEGAFENSMLDALTTAMANRHEVTAFHDAGDARVISLHIEPA